MPKTLTIAAVQMDVTPTPAAERRQRAESLIAGAVQDGAQLVVLPEAFNTGYVYLETNYEAAEKMDGPTVSWMKEQARQHAIHLAGSLFILDGDHIYNRALLIAPDGRLWQYDKHYPWGWERAFFREGQKITIAETDLGKLGMLICWDAAHPELWRRYAGRVDAMLIVSCPPSMNQLRVRLPDDTLLDTTQQEGVLGAAMDPEGHFAIQDIDEQAAWLGVPMVHSSGGGIFRSPAPAARTTVGGMMLLYPQLWRYLPLVEGVTLEADYGQHTKVVRADGSVAARVASDGDGYVVSEVELPETTPIPTGEQPPVRTPAAAFFFSDVYLPALTIPVYRRGIRRQWGARMAPVDPRTQLWLSVVAVAAALAWLIGRFSRK